MYISVCGHIKLSQKTRELPILKKDEGVICLYVYCATRFNIFIFILALVLLWIQVLVLALFLFLIYVLSFISIFQLAFLSLCVFTCVCVKGNK